jgi:hypothetical protein
MEAEIQLTLGKAVAHRANDSKREAERARRRLRFLPALATPEKQSPTKTRIASLRCSETKSLTHVGHSEQPVIPGEWNETRNPGRENWIPAFAGMTIHLRRTLDDETSVGAHGRAPLLLGGMTARETLPVFFSCLGSAWACRLIMALPFFSSPLRGEDIGEGDGCRRPLSLSLSHNGERGPEAEPSSMWTTPHHVGVPSMSHDGPTSLPGHGLPLTFERVLTKVSPFPLVTLPK